MPRPLLSSIGLMPYDSYYSSNLYHICFLTDSSSAFCCTITFQQASCHAITPVGRRPVVPSSFFYAGYHAVHDLHLFETPSWISMHAKGVSPSIIFILDPSCCIRFHAFRLSSYYMCVPLHKCWTVLDVDDPSIS